MASSSHESYHRYERPSKSSRSSRSIGKRQLPKTSSERSAKTTTRESTASYISSSQTGGEAYTPETGSKQSSHVLSWQSLQHSSQHHPAHNTIFKDSSAADRSQQDYPDYAADIIAGAASLGIEASPELQQVLVQRYGELWMRGSYTYGDDNPGGCEDGFGSIQVDVQDTVRYDDEDWACDGYLVGVGAQFERN